MAARFSHRTAFPFGPLNVALVVTFGLFVGAGVLAWQTQQALERRDAHAYAMGTVLQQLAYHERALDHYRDLVLDTKSDRWLPAYEQALHELDAAIDTAVEVAPGPYARSGARAMRVAHEQLSHLERQAIRAALAGRRGRIDSLLTSPDFSSSIERYDLGALRFSTGLQPDLRLAWLQREYQTLAERASGWAWRAIETELPGWGPGTWASDAYRQTMTAELADLAPDLPASGAYTSFADAYERVVHAEQRSLDSLEAGNQDAAVRLLEGASYAEAQEQLRFASAALSVALQERIDAQRVKHGGATLVGLLILTGLGLLAGVWWYVLRLMRRHLQARTRAEDALAYNETRQRALLNALPDVTLVFDAVGVVQSVHAAEEPPFLRGASTGAPPAAGRPLADVVAPAAASALAAASAEALATQDVQPAEFSVETVGTPAYFEARVAPEGDARTVALIRDVTERREAEAALVRAKEEAEEAMQTKSAFLANMSHEVRTPLTGILGFATVLEEEVPNEQKEFARLIRSSGERLLHTINALLDLSRLEAGGLRIAPERVDVVAEVADAVRFLQPLAQRKSLACAFETPHESLEACVDENALRIVVNNLVGNALKFTDEGGVCVRLWGGEEEIWIGVADTGPGISEAFLPHLFKEFRQERSHEGSGLGLAITKRVVELHGGRVEVATQEGGGSTFTVRLPRWPAPAVDASTPAPLR